MLGLLLIIFLIQRIHKVSNLCQSAITYFYIINLFSSSSSVFVTFKNYSIKILSIFDKIKKKKYQNKEIKRKIRNYHTHTHMLEYILKPLKNDCLFPAWLRHKRLFWIYFWNSLCKVSGNNLLFNIQQNKIKNPHTNSTHIW